MPQVLHPQHLRIEEPRELRQHPFERGEERGVIESPFGGLFVVPLLHGEGMGYCQPVPVDFKVGGLAVRVVRNVVFEDGGEAGRTRRGTGGV